MAFGEDFVSGKMDGSDRDIVTLRLENILGDVDQHRAGTPAGGDVEGLVYHLRQVFQFLDQIVVLGAGACDAEGVGFLGSVAADQLTGDLASEGHDGDGIHHGIHEAGNQVGGAGSCGGAADTHFAGSARV